ncbi:MAG: prepilin-type N-terminal cleavage/methylation domain-containing protein [Gemmatimonadota bacterium]
MPTHSARRDPGVHSSDSPGWVFARDRRGFTIIEILVVMIVVGVLVKIALPRYHELRNQAVAGKMAGDYHAVRLAAYAYYTERLAWPAEAGPGVVPPELVSDLPEGFDFNRGEYVLDWENWALPSGLPQFPGRDMLMALSVSTSDSALALTILNKLGSRTVHFNVGNTTTFVIVPE